MIGIGRLAIEVQDGDLVWTRDRSGGYFLGLVAGIGRIAANRPMWG